MPVPVFIDEILRWSLAQRAKPLWAIGSHINKVAGRHRVPMVVEPIDAFAFQHQQAMLHDVNFYHGQGSSRLKSHSVYRKIERRVLGHQGAYSERVVAQQGLGLSAAFIAGEGGGSGG